MALNQSWRMRSRSPIGGRLQLSLDDARWVAGSTYPLWVCENVIRIACPMNPARDLLVAHEAGEDRQSGGVGRGPALGPLRQRQREVEDRARARVQRFVGPSRYFAVNSS